MTSREQYPWLQQSRTLLIDAYWPPLNPELDFDAEKLVHIAKQLNADTIRFGTIGKCALVQNDVVPLHPELGFRDLLAEIVTVASREKIRIIAYVPVGHGLPRGLVKTQRPAWGLRMDNGELQSGVRHFGGEPVVPVCTFGSYRDDIAGFIRHIVNKYDIHGLYLDGPYYNWNMGTLNAICQCEYCRKAFQVETGRPLPSNRELFGSEINNTELHNLFQNWVGAKLLKLLRDIVDIAKQEKNLPVMFNAISAAFRPPDLERQMISTADGFLLESDISGLRGLGVGNHYGKIIWRYTQPHSAWPRLSTPFIERQNEQSGHETLTWGGTPIISYGGRLLADNACREPVTRLFDFMKRNAARLEDLDPELMVGVISESRIRNGSAITGTVLADAYKLLQQIGAPTAVVIKDALSELTALKPYPVLFLPGNIELTPTEADTLRHYVRGGGTLIATGTASAIDGEFQLTDVFGAIPLPTERAEIALDQFQFCDQPWDVYLRPECSSKLLPVKHITLVEVKDDAHVAATLVTGQGKALAPGMVLHRFGAGLCCYISFSIERANEEGSQLAEWLGSVLDTLHPAPWPAMVSCSHCIYSSLWSKPGAKLLLLSNPKVEERVFTLDFYIASNVTPVSVHDLVTECDLEYEFTGDRVTVKNYKFTDFACIIITIKE